MILNAHANSLRVQRVADVSSADLLVVNVQAQAIGMCKEC